MIVVCSMILFFFLLLLIFARKQPVFVEFEMDSKDHPFYKFYPMVSFLLQHVKQEGRWKKEELGTVYRKIAAVLFGILVLSSLIFLSELMQLSKAAVISEDRIRRPQVGEGALTVDAGYQVDQESGEMTLTVKERILTGVQREALFSKSFEWLDQNLKGENESLGMVTTNLMMVKKIPATGVNVSYQIEGKEYLKKDGTILFENVSEEGVTFSLRVILSYEDSSREKEYIVSIDPKEKSFRETVMASLETELMNSDSDSATEEYWQLPEEIDGIDVEWKEKNSNSVFLLVLLGGIIIICIPFLIDQRNKEKQQRREEQMLIDYPEIICKFTLLIKAGMTISAAWDRMAGDYLMQRENKSTKPQQKSKKRMKKKEKKRLEKEIRYAYEEMIQTSRELSLGVSEEKAYEEFGKRCHSLPYLRFSTVLVQNLKKGTRCIAQILDQEAREAFQERKEQAKRRGEKASTKLLAPTAGMLIIVLCIIMVPAFLSF